MTTISQGNDLKAATTATPNTYKAGSCTSITTTPKSTTTSSTGIKKTNKEGKRFDWFPIYKNEDLECLVQELQEEALKNYKVSLQGATASTRSKEVKDISRQLISALFMVCDEAEWRKEEIKPVSFPLSKGAYSKKAPQKISFSYRYSKEVAEAAINLGWVNKVKGIDGRYTRLYPTELFKSKVQPQLLTWLEQEPLPADLLIRMKDVVRDSDGQIIYTRKGKPKKVGIPLKHDERLESWTKDLRAYNKYLSKQCISLDVTDEQLGIIEAKISNKSSKTELNPRNVQLYRSFSMNNYNYGGRLYGGFWQTVPPAFRPHILINNKRTGELDYSGMSIIIIYALLDKEFNSSRDPYDIGLEGYSSDDPRRDIVKKILLALINDMHGTYRIKLKDLRLLGLTEFELMRRFKKYLPEIVDIFHSDYGLRAQYEDSEIVMKMLKYAQREDIPILPIHDSFIAPFGSVLAALQIMMKKTLRESLGVECNITLSPTRTNKEFGLEDHEVISRGQDPKNVIVNASDCFDSWISRYDENQKMKKYYGSYERLKYL